MFASFRGCQPFSARVVNALFLYEYDYYNNQHQGSNSAKNPRRSDLVAAASAGGDCCPHVVDPIFYFGILAGIAVAVYYINQAITMNLRRRKRRKRNTNSDTIDNQSHFLMIGKYPSYYRIIQRFCIIL